MMKHRALWPWMLGFVLGTALLTAWHGWNADHIFRSELLQKGQSLAAALNPQRLDHLSATAEDLHSPIYRRLKNQLDTIFPLYPHIQYIYLMRQQPDGTVVFLLAAAPTSSPDLALPGQPYPEASPELRQTLSHNTPTVVGPLPDSWGIWVSALVPLPTRHPTLLGMDVPQETYWRHLLLACIPPLALGTVGALLFAWVWRTQWPRRDCLLAMLVGAAISGQAAGAVWVLEQDAHQHIDALLGSTEAQRLRAHLTMARDHMLGNLAGLYASSEEVTPSAFLTFTQSWRTNPALDVAGFIAHGSKVLSPATEPGLVGMGLTISELAWAMEESSRTDLPTAVLTSFFGRPTPSLALIQPVWKGSRLLGHVLVALDLARLLHGASTEGILALEELEPKAGPLSDRLWPILVGGRTFALSVSTAALKTVPLGLASGATLLVGLLVTALAARLTHDSTRRRQILAQMVKRRTEQLRRLLRRLHALYTNSLTGIALHELVRDRHGTPATYRYLDANPAFVQHTGLDVDSIRGKTVEQALGVEEPPFLSTYAAVVKNQAAVSFATEFAPLGRHFVVNAFPLPEPDTFATVFLDTTAWVQAEAGQRQATQNLRALLEALPIPVFFKDREGRYTEVNPAFGEFFGRPAAEFLGKTLAEAFPQTLADFFQDKDAQLWATGGVQIYSTTLTRADGTARRVLFHKRVLLNEQGEATGMVGAFTDITEQEETAQRLRAANARLEEAVERIGNLAAQAEAAQRAKERFIAMLSHDLRAPAAGVLSAAKLLAQNERSPEDHALVVGIQASAQGMLDLLEDTLTLSSLENDGLPMLQQRLDIASTLAEAAASLAPLAQTKGLDLTTTLPPLPPVLGDARRIRQLATNLLSNAIKFTERGSVELRAREIQQTADTLTLEIRVTDTGPGIPAEDHERIFQPYGQRDPARDGAMGVGLGLALCREIATRMGGSIGVESAPGQGASFWVHLPLPLAIEHDTLPRKVLLADDDPVARTLALTWLTRQGITTVTVEDGHAALATLQAEADIEAAILDLSMPGLGGLELARRIRQGSGGVRPNLPLVALTAADSEVGACAAAGFDAYLTKPVDAETLMFALTQAVASRNEPA